MADDSYRAPKGTHDVLPPESGRWIEVVSAFASRAERAGFGLLLTPVFEHVEVFARVGETTDVVSKEMYEFTDKGGRALALRPEGTAPVVRAFVQHHPTTPWKVWYLAPNFRYERPQKGRYRQHTQLGVEVLGTDDPLVDVEVIALAHGFYRDLGLEPTLLVNSMGDAESLPRYVEKLREYLMRHADDLGDDFAARVAENPLRVLDTKNPAWADVVERAPQLTESLGDAALAHFEAVQHGLDVLGIDHVLDPRLVRGFDYYTSTTFEFVTDRLDAAQNALGGGGRYDRMAQDMGGPATPSIGFGIGIERVLLAMGEGVETGALDVFVVDTVGGDEGLRLLHQLREEGLRADRAPAGRSMKAQWKVADRSRAPWGLLLAPDEHARGVVGVKALTDASVDQIEVPLGEVAGWIKARVETTTVENGS